MHELDKVYSVRVRSSYGPDQNSREETVWVSAASKDGATTLGKEFARQSVEKGFAHSREFIDVSFFEDQESLTQGTLDCIDLFSQHIETNEYPFQEASIMFAVENKGAFQSFYKRNSENSVAVT